MIRASSAAPSAGSESSLHPGVLCWLLQGVLGLCSVQVSWSCTLGIAGSHFDSGSAGQALLHLFLLRAGSQASYTAVKKYFADCLALHRQGQRETLTAVTSVVARWIVTRQSLCVAEFFSGQ